MNKSIIIEEQGLRDGIQNLSTIIPTEKKVAYIHQLVDAGIKRIQVASFVHPKLVPQMADAALVCASINKKPNVLYSGLVLNEKGVERGIAAGLNHLSCSISASDTHSQKNARKTILEARQSFQNMVKLCKQNDLLVRGGIQCAFGCRYEGEIKREHIYDMVKSHLDADIDELSLADSTGMGNPQQILEMMHKIIELAGSTPIILHLHNTENKGYANLFAAIYAGVKIFDTAFGGLGGCPFIKGASGNIATEDSVHMIEQMGYSTGVNIDKIALVSKEMEKILGVQLESKLYEGQLRLKN